MRYVDRFLMYYVRTADRLQRTSVWLENLEGGLDYLGTWSSTTAWAWPPSWKRTCSTWWTPMRASGRRPSTTRTVRKRFRHFVNSDKHDGNMVFVEERGQIRPATADERRRP